MRVTIMSGVPGSGKSTIAEKIRLAEPDDTLVVSADDHFMTADGGYKYDPAQQSAAHASCFNRFMTMLFRDAIGHLVVDNTNTTAWEISPYYLAAQAFGAEVRVVRVKCDSEQAFKRQRHEVPFQTFCFLAAAFGKRDVMPWWTVDEIES